MSTIQESYSFIDYRADGVSDQFIITMDIMVGYEAEHLKVYLQDTLVDPSEYTQDATKITLNTVPEVDSVVSLVRDTSSSARMVDFNDFTKVSKEKLDIDSLQDFYLAQEAFDSPKRALQYDHVNESIDAKDYNIKNLLDPIDAQDAATKVFVENQNAAVLQDAKDYSDTQDVVQDGVLSTLMDTKDAGLKVLTDAADVVLQDQITLNDADIAAIQGKTDFITVTQDVNLDEMEAAIAGGGSGTISEWTTGILYAVDAIIWEGEDFYRCILGHTSGATFIGDAANWEIMSGTLDASEVKATYESNLDTNVFTDAEKTKLGTIEDSATADQTGVEIKALYEAEADTNAFTDAEQSKLTLLESSRFLGTYVDLAALNTAHPTASEGEYANVDTGLGSDVMRYLWDLSDSAWVLGTGAAMTAAEIKSLYESNLDTNAFTDAEKALVASTDVSVGLLKDINTDTKEPSGFIDDDYDHHGVIEYTLDGTTIFQIDTTGIYSENSTGLWHDGVSAVAGDIRISPKDAGNPIVYYIKGVKHALTTGVSTSGTSTYTGIHIMYLDSDELLHENLGYDSAVITEKALVSIVYWNADFNEMVDFGAERHGIDMDGATHKWLHENSGAQYKGGMAVQGLVKDSPTFTQIDVGYIDDEDISHDCPVQTVAPYWYLEGTSWRTVVADNNLGYVGTGTGVSYNLDTAGVFSLAEVTGNSCVIMFTLGTHNAPNKYVRVIGQGVYAKVSAARGAIASEVNSLKLNGLPSPEFIFVNAYIINAAGELQLDAEDNTHLDLRTSSIAGLGVNSTATVHANTTNRDALNSHPATAVSFDPSISGIDPLIIDTQAAIDKALVSGGISDPSIYEFIDADSIDVTDWDRTALVNATLVKNEVAPLSGDADYKFTTTATSAGETAHYDFDVSQRAQDRRDHIFKLPYRFDGTEGYLSLELYDLTNSKTIKTIFADPNEVSGGSIFTMPVGCTQVRVILKSITGEASVFQFDQISFSDEGINYGNATTVETITRTGYTSRNASDYMLLSTEKIDQGSEIIEQSNTDHTRYTFLRGGKFTSTAVMSGGSNLRMILKQFDKNDVLLMNNQQSTDDAGVGTVNLEGAANEGDYIVYFLNSTTGDSNSTSFSVTATAQSETANIEGNREQGHFKGKAIYNLSALYSTTSATYVLPSLSLTSSTLSGVVEQNTANAPSITIPDAKVGTYLVTVTGDQMGQGSNSFASMFDGTVYHSEQVQSGGYASGYSFTCEHLAKGDLNLDFMVKTSGTSYIQNLAPLELSVSYLPPVEEATVKTLYQLPVSKENDCFIKVAGEAGHSITRQAGDVVASVARNATAGVFDVTYNAGITSLPFIDPTLFSTGDYLGIQIYSESLTGCQVFIQNKSNGSGAYKDFQLYISKSGADRTPPGVWAGNVPKVRHSNYEFDSGQTWVDGRTIYGRSFEVASDVGDSVTLTTWDAGLEPLGCGRVSVNNHVILNGSTAAATHQVFYEDDTGLVRTNTSSTMYAGTKVTMYYVK